MRIFPFLAATITLLLVTSFISLNLDIGVIRIDAVKERIDVPSQMPHNPVVITSDSSWASAGFEGSGTPEEPYKVYSLWINSEDAIGIFIGHTSAHFIIWNCLITGSYAGIRLLDCVNANISSTQLLSQETCISVEDTISLIIENCEMIPSEEGIGLSLVDISFGYVTNNIISGGSTGCYIDSSCIFFSGNTITETIYGIKGDTARSSMFYNNHFENCSAYGICFEDGSLSCYIANNTFKGFFTGGVLLRRAQNMSVLLNNFTHCGLTVIGDDEYQFDHIVTSNFVNSKPLGYFKSLSDMTLSGDDYGQIHIVSSTNFSVKGGLITSTQRGVSLHYSSNCRIEDIMITACRVGIDLSKSESNTIENCTIRSCVTGILFMNNADNNDIVGNYIGHSDEYGILINPYITGNLFVNNTFVKNDDGLIDNGFDNDWDDGAYGNIYDDYSGYGTYTIPGTAGSVDHHPRRYVPEQTGTGIFEILSNPVFLLSMVITIAGLVIVVIFLKRIWSSKS